MVVQAGGKVKVREFLLLKYLGDGFNELPVKIL